MGAFGPAGLSCRAYMVVFLAAMILSTAHADSENPSCGGCTWTVTSGTLNLTGAPVCGSGCPDYLDFVNLGISTIDPGAFNTTGLQHVKSLMMSEDQLTVLPSRLFDMLTGLTFLVIGDTQLTTLPSGIFDKLERLGTLGLVYNQLSTLPSGIFDKNTNLGTIDFDGNKLTGLPAGVFDKNIHLTRVTISNNLMTTLPSGIFDQLTSLTELYMDAADTWNCSVSIPSSATTVMSVTGVPPETYTPTFDDFDTVAYSALPACVVVSDPTGPTDPRLPPWLAEVAASGRFSDPRCSETRSKSDLLVIGRADSEFFVSGGLGGRGAPGIGVWMCFANHSCLQAVGASHDDRMCYAREVRNGTYAFHAMGLNSELGLCRATESLAM